MPYDDFKQAIDDNETILEIVSTANSLNDPADFGINVANILHNKKLIDDAVFEILTGQI